MSGYGGYSYYTTCMLDTNSGNQIVYRDTYPALPDGDNVMEFYFGGVPVDFTDASTYYRVSTVNYLAAGACNLQRRRGDPVAARPDRRRHAVLRA